MKKTPCGLFQHSSVVSHGIRTEGEMKVPASTSSLCQNFDALATKKAALYCTEVPEQAGKGTQALPPPQNIFLARHKLRLYMFAWPLPMDDGAQTQS